MLSNSAKTTTSNKWRRMKNVAVKPDTICIHSIKLLNSKRSKGTGSYISSGSVFWSGSDSPIQQTIDISQWLPAGTEIAQSDIFDLFISLIKAGQRSQSHWNCWTFKADLLHQYADSPFCIKGTIPSWRVSVAP